MAPLTIACPACGFPESRLKYSLQLGCPACYESFAPHLCTFLPKLHTGTTHKGKTPPPSTAEDLLQRIDALASRIALEAPDSSARPVTDMLPRQIRARSQNHTQ
jgi:protein-arginine kinase activator protein McsA